MGAAVKRRALAGALVAAVAASTPSCSANDPALSFATGVPADVRILARSTWDRFLAAFSARIDCLGGVQVAVAWELGDRAAYHPEERRVTVRVPATAPNLEASLLHEFGHHLERTCHRVADVRPAFLAAQGFPPGASWFTGATWETTPSEQFAEAVAEFVLGEPPAHRPVRVTDGALDAVRAWARGA